MWSNSGFMNKPISKEKPTNKQIKEATEKVKAARQRQFEEYIENPSKIQNNEQFDTM